MTADQLGEIRKEFKPGLENLIAGFIIGALLIGGGCVAVYFPAAGVIDHGGNLPMLTDNGKKEWSWAAVGFLLAVGVGAIIGGLALIRWVRSLFSYRVRVGQSGLAVSKRSTARVIGWDEIVSVEETHLYERPPLLKGVAKYVLPKLMSRSFIVAVRDGEAFAFDGNTVKGHGKLAEMIKEQTGARNVPWAIKEEHGY